MLSTLSSLIAKFIVALAARLFGDWRRDVALKEEGVAQERERVATSVSAGERRAAEVPSRSDDETIDTLEKGTF